MIEKGRLYTSLLRNDDRVGRPLDHGLCFCFERGMNSLTGAGTKLNARYEVQICYGES